MSSLIMTQEFVISNPDGWKWTISSPQNEYVIITLTDKTGDGNAEPFSLTMTKEEADLISNAIKMLT